MIEHFVAYAQKTVGSQMLIYSVGRGDMPYSRMAAIHQILLAFPHVTSTLTKDGDPVWASYVQGFDSSGLHRSGVAFGFPLPSPGENLHGHRSWRHAPHDNWEPKIYIGLNCLELGSGPIIQEVQKFFKSGGLARSFNTRKALASIEGEVRPWGLAVPLPLSGKAAA